MDHARAWNSLPIDIRCASSFYPFKRLLKTYLFREAFSLNLLYCTCQDSTAWIYYTHFILSDKIRIIRVPRIEQLAFVEIVFFTYNKHLFSEIKHAYFIIGPNVRSNLAMKKINSSLLSVQ